ncbi:hypothetical protein [Paracoccus sphaerophysae]|nr:hypothetical protein [Paracoccus sphaerophysae]
MSKKLVLLLVATGVLAACQPQPTTTVVQPAVVAPEPVFQGKYGAN